MTIIMFLGLLFLLCGGGLLPSWGADGTAVPSSAVEPSEEVVAGHDFYTMNGCSMVPSGTSDLRINLKMIGPVSCDTKKVLIIPSGHTVTVHADGAMKASRLGFVVEPGAQLNLAADTSITLERGEDEKGMPIVEVGGELIVYAGIWNNPARTWPDEMFLQWNEGKQAQQDILVKTGDGKVYAEQSLTFTANSFVVAAAGEGDEHAEESATEATTDRLREGEVLLLDGILTSSDHSSQLWPGPHGSLLFGKYATDNLVKDGDASRLEVSTIIPANGAKVKSTLKIRAELERESANGGGATVKTESKRAWTPWGRRYNRRVEMARQHAGEVELSVDDQGCVEVTVDGYCVLSRSGPYTWEWLNRFPCRRWKRPGYELCVVNNGLEVQREGKKIWGLNIVKDDSGKSGVK